MSDGRVVALGGGHGLANTLRAATRFSADVTAVVVVSDDGGSSGRLRQDFGIIPPGDLRRALAALCPDDDEGRLWADVLQHRFAHGELEGHAVGNLLITALWEHTGDPVTGLERLGALLRTRGRVLPVALEPLDIVANVEFADGMREVRGQVAVATTIGDVRSVRLEPAEPTACPDAVAAIETADLVVLGPGSWFSSVLTHLLVPDIRDALARTAAAKTVVLNLAAQPGETSGFAPETHLDVLHELAPELRVDAVVTDPAWVGDSQAILDSAARLGARVVPAAVGTREGGGPHHDPVALAAVLRVLATRGRIAAWP